MFSHLGRVQHERLAPGLAGTVALGVALRVHDRERDAVRGRDRAVRRADQPGLHRVLAGARRL